MRVLFVCTANICRSPMASGLFAKSAHVNGAVGAISASAGFLEGGRPVHPAVTRLLDERAIDVSRKKSQKISQDLVDKSDLILTMTSDHARGVVSRFPRAISDVYTLRHFGTIVTQRPAGVSTREWLDDLNVLNRRAYLGDDEILDIPDPIGHAHKVFAELVIELENSIGWIMGCAYPASSQAKTA
jgi:protein-tyrosine-phosphatase